MLKKKLNKVAEKVAVAFFGRIFMKIKRDKNVTQVNIFIFLKLASCSRRQLKERETNISESAAKKNLFILRMLGGLYKWSTLSCSKLIEWSRALQTVHRRPGFWHSKKGRSYTLGPMANRAGCEDG